ncbi:DEAD/DEAH box helicase [Thermogemmatispora carboxidivorans]|uniref:DEAD/DEAH box helicase n=1 Tax=Thermogemmatispora carboxidivorans TaxID=1382306 RepID=UPI00138E19D2|nr:DEAD/DEAH box helicase [Thermogemmatispora carboxidivorans]
MEALVRRRPPRDLRLEDLTGELGAIAQLLKASEEEQRHQDSSPAAKEGELRVSTFQVEGWEKALQVIRHSQGMVITAPTGSGKTEVFLLPIIYEITRQLAKKVPANQVPRFVLLYPRVALLKDQLERVLRYVYRAELEISQKSMWGEVFHPERGRITIGFQFGGVGPDPESALENSEIFESRTFIYIDKCVICKKGSYELKSVKYNKRKNTLLKCNNCGANFHVSIGRNYHADLMPHLLITTAESFDQISVYPLEKFENYIKSITGIVLDEAHVYHSIYGAHIHHMLRRLEELRGGQALAKLAASATILEPERFAASLFYGEKSDQLVVHKAEDGSSVPTGLELLYVLQKPEEQVEASSLLIQAVMAVGHALLRGEGRSTVFCDSLDMVGRFHAQISDAEEQRRLWSFRCNLEQLCFNQRRCPRTVPASCRVYEQGECWRGLPAGEQCTNELPDLHMQPLKIVEVTSKAKATYHDEDIILATAAFEIGVDDSRIQAVIQYLIPHTLFSFIQRRGRAGRGWRSTAYSMLVLDTSPISHFYLRHYRRLIEGSYELPLKTDNPVISAIHGIISRKRKELAAYTSLHKVEKGLLQWIWNNISNCGIIKHYYGDELINYGDASLEEKVKFLKEWINTNKIELEHKLGLKSLIDRIEDEICTLEETARLSLDFLKQEGSSSEEISKRFLEIDNYLSNILYNTKDKYTIEKISYITRKMAYLWKNIADNDTNNFSDVERLYKFFFKLGELFKDKRILRYPPEAMKIVLQASFYLHLDDTSDSACTYRVEYLLPEGYFLATKPILVNASLARGEGVEPETKVELENIGVLANALIPYRTLYRYYARHISTIDVVPLPERSSDQEITIRLRGAEGLHHAEFFAPYKVSVRTLETDKQGQQVVKMCEQCRMIYSISRTRHCCDSQLRYVTLQASPVIKRSYAVGPAERRLTFSLSLLKTMKGVTMVEGAEVSARRMLPEANGHYVPQKRPPLSFLARYEIPLRYDLTTDGIRWQLQHLVTTLLADQQLQRELGQIKVQGQLKHLDSELILHTAAHMLYKTIATISGVNEQALEYWYDVQRCEVVVWEGYEGGTGLSEVFAHALKTRPKEVYQALLACVLCPIHLAEDPQQPIEPGWREELGRSWLVSSEPMNPLSQTLSRQMVLDQIADEAEWTRQHSSGRLADDESSKLSCYTHDGCPVCIYVTTCCRGRYRQAPYVSRRVGEALLRQLLRRTSRSEVDQLHADAARLGLETVACWPLDRQGREWALFLL